MVLVVKKTFSEYWPFSVTTVRYRLSLFRGIKKPNSRDYKETFIK